MSDAKLRAAIRAFSTGDISVTSHIIRGIPSFLPETQQIVQQLPDDKDRVLLATILINYDKLHLLAQDHVEKINQILSELAPDSHPVQPLKNIFWSEPGIFTSKAVWGGQEPTPYLIFYVLDYQSGNFNVFSSRKTPLISALQAVIHA
jgi:hypothetical protein